MGGGHGWTSRSMTSHGGARRRWERGGRGRERSEGCHGREEEVREGHHGGGGGLLGSMVSAAPCGS
jgi:hypothetical protein